MKAEGIVTNDTVRRDVSEDARNVMWETTHGEGWEIGIHWIWSARAGELYTAAGLQVLIDALHAACLEADAITLRRWLPTPEPVSAAPIEKIAPPATAPARRNHHLPYADPDDEQIFKIQHASHAH